MIAGVMVGAQISGRAAGRISGQSLVTGALLVSVAGGLLNVLLVSLPLGSDLPWAVIGPAVIAVGTAAAYPTLQLLLLDMFPSGRGAAVSMFTFFTLVLNGLTAAAARAGRVGLADHDGPGLHRAGAGRAGLVGAAPGRRTPRGRRARPDAPHPLTARAAGHP